MGWGKGIHFYIISIRFSCYYSLCITLTSRRTLYKIQILILRTFQNEWMTSLQLRKCQEVRFAYSVGIKCKSLRKYKLTCGSFLCRHQSVGWMTHTMLSSSSRNHHFHVSLIAFHWRPNLKLFQCQRFQGVLCPLVVDWGVWLTQ